MQNEIRLLSFCRISCVAMNRDMFPLQPQVSGSGRPRIGLVLGAGGTRGCAHAGVIEVLRNAGIPIDVVVGASVGAVFGLGVATNQDTEHIARTAHDVSLLPMARFYAGRLRLDRRNPVARMLREAAGDRTFEELPVPFAVRVTDMESGQPEVIASGPVLPAVQASIALPMIARPVKIDGRLYMDGGMFDTAPVSVARAMGADLVIAVCLGVNYVAPRWMRRRPWTQPFLDRAATGKRPPRGSMIDQLRFTCRVFASSYRIPEPSRDADIAIWPEFGSVGPNSIGQGPFCYRQGVTAALDALPVVQQTIRSLSSATA